MTPPPLRPEAVQRRLREMRELLGVLRRHADVTGDELRTDLERRLVVERALQQLVDLAVKINAHVATAAGLPAPASYYTSFLAAAEAGALDEDLAEALAPSTGLRNRLVQEYEEIDLTVVASALPGAVDGYSDYVRRVAGWLQEQADPES